MSKRIGHAAWLAREFMSLIREDSCRERFAGIMNFSYQHYALGDVRRVPGTYMMFFEFPFQDLKPPAVVGKQKLLALAVRLNSY